MPPPACWRRAAKPSPARKRWSRSAARARRAGRLSPRSLRASGVDVELRREGTLVLALTADDQAEIAHRLEFQRRLGLPLEWLSAAATRAARAASCRQDRRRAVFAGKTIRSITASSRRRCASPPKRLAWTFIEHRPVKEIVVQGGRAKGVCSKTARTAPADIVVLRRRRLVAQHRRIAAGSAAAGASGQGPDAVAAHGCGGAASHSRAVGAGRLSRCRGATAGLSSAPRSRKRVSTTPSPPAAC